MKTFVALAALILTNSSYAQGLIEPNYNQTAATECCASLNTKFPTQVLYQGNSSFLSDNPYWSQLVLENSKPACLVFPKAVAEVAQVVETLVNSECPFAVRGGGHSPWPNAASSNGGVTISLKYLANVSLSEDHNQAYIDAGAYWQDVYEYLDPLNVSVPGGRIPDVGVSGLTLGGGMSYFSPRYGFVADNVLEYQIVLANGTVVSANNATNTGIFWALKGGSNNFGIVTRFTLRAFPQPEGELWGGILFYPDALAPLMFGALENFTKSSTYDLNSSMATFNVYSTLLGGWTILNQHVYTAPAVLPDCYKPFTEPPFQTLPKPYPQPTIRNATLLNITTEGDEYLHGLRNTFSTITFVNNASIFLESYLIFQKVVNETVPVVKNASAFMMSLGFEPLPLEILKHGAGPFPAGNAMNISTSQGDLMLAVMSGSWSSAVDDAVVLNATRTAMNLITKNAADKGQKSDWLYLNYADEIQDVIGGYGTADRLKAISKEYDPSGVFQNLVPGGFKLDPAHGKDSFPNVGQNLSIV